MGWHWVERAWDSGEQKKGQCDCSKAEGGRGSRRSGSRGRQGSDSLGCRLGLTILTVVGSGWQNRYGGGSESDLSYRFKEPRGCQVENEGRHSSLLSR